MKSVAERFWAKVGPVAPDDCWPWTAYCQPKGYGLLKVDGVMRLAHRISYLINLGPIPEGLQLDHLCRNKRCVNPAHLEAVTGRQNVLRGLAAVPAVACRHGHRYTTENTYVANGRQHCRACQRAASLAYSRRSGRFKGVGVGFRSDLRRASSQR